MGKMCHNIVIKCQIRRVYINFHEEMSKILNKNLVNSFHEGIKWTKYV